MSGLFCCFGLLFIDYVVHVFFRAIDAITLKLHL